MVLTEAQRHGERKGCTQRRQEVKEGKEGGGLFNHGDTEDAEDRGLKDSLRGSVAL